jgi:S-DNA-T family DNA segregation ATPase FtsK/SpoIIIE
MPHEQRRAIELAAPRQPSALPSLAEERSRLWGSNAGDRLTRVPPGRYGTCTQPLSVELVPPESAPIDKSTRSPRRPCTGCSYPPVLPDLPASAMDLRAFAGSRSAAPRNRPGRGRARSSARPPLMHDPTQLVIAVLTTPSAPCALGLDQVAAARPLGPSSPTRPARARWCDRPSTTSLRCCRPTSTDRPRFGGTSAASVAPHILLVVDGATLPPGIHVVTPRRPPRGHHARPARPLGRTRRRVPAAPAPRPAAGGRTGHRGGSLRRAPRPVRGYADQCDRDRRGLRPAAHPPAHAGEAEVREAP